MTKRKTKNFNHLIWPIALSVLALVVCASVLAALVYQETDLWQVKADDKSNAVSTMLSVKLSSVLETNTTLSESSNTIAPTAENSSTLETIAARIEPQVTVCETETGYTEPPQFGNDTQPDELTWLLDNHSVTYEDLALKDCTQLITVVAEGSSAWIRFYSCSNGLWQEVPQLSCLGYVGYSGVLSDKYEGDGGTPAGMYAIGSGFYIQDAPETALELFQITPDTYWVDDPNSVYYNQRVEGTDRQDWGSAEHMIQYDVYRYGFVVEYNTAGVYGAGSAIFFHIGDQPTAGCIATAENMVLAYLADLDQSRQPHILISGS